MIFVGTFHESHIIFLARKKKNSQCYGEPISMPLTLRACVKIFIAMFIVSQCASQLIASCFRESKGMFIQDLRTLEINPSYK